MILVGLSHLILFVDFSLSLSLFINYQIIFFIFESHDDREEFLLSCLALPVYGTPSAKRGFNVISIFWFFFLFPHPKLSRVFCANERFACSLCEMFSSQHVACVYLRVNPVCWQFIFMSLVVKNWAKEIKICFLNDHNDFDGLNLHLELAKQILLNWILTNKFF